MGGEMIESSKKAVLRIIAKEDEVEEAELREAA